MDPRPRLESARDAKVVSEVADDDGAAAGCQGFGDSDRPIRARGSRSSVPIGVDPAAAPCRVGARRATRSGPTGSILGIPQPGSESLYARAR